MEARVRLLSRQINALRRQISPLRALFALFLFIGYGPFALTQSFTSSIAGNVTDPSGAAVTGAQIELKNTGTDDVHSVTTESQGSYQFNNLPPGTYQISVTSPGFKTYVQSNLILQAQIATAVNVALQLGNTQQKVEVQGSTVLVDTETANNSVTMDSHLIEALPNSTRNPLNFVLQSRVLPRRPAARRRRADR